MEQNDIVVGGMHIELFPRMGQVQENTIVIPQLPHGSNIVTIRSGKEDVRDCDALITENRGLSLGIRTADCAAVCFGDGKAIGIAHIGWRGLCRGLIEKMTDHFDASALAVYVAPFLHSFEIKKDFCYEEVTGKFGMRHIEQRPGKLVFNFKDAISSLLPPRTVYDSRNIATDLSFPSYRRDKTKDRFVTAVSFS